MAKLLYSAAASLDGYIAGPGGDMSWLTEHLGGENPTADRLLANVGAILAGSRTSSGDDPNRGTDQEGAFGGQYHGPVFVLTHRPPAEAPAGVTFVGDLRSGVAQAKEAADDKYVNVLGANVAKQCIETELCRWALPTDGAPTRHALPVHRTFRAARIRRCSATSVVGRRVPKPRPSCGRGHIRPAYRAWYTGLMPRLSLRCEGGLRLLGVEAYRDCGPTR